MNFEAYKAEFIQYRRLYPDEINAGPITHINMDEPIKKAEKMIGVSFPESYKDFLRDFTYATIFGDEMFSLFPEYYQNDRSNEIAYPEDITFRYLADMRGDHSRDPKHVEACHCNWDDERYFFDFNHYHADTSECDVFREVVLCAPVLFAKNYYEFLCKRIRQYIE